MVGESTTKILTNTYMEGFSQPLTFTVGQESLICYTSAINWVQINKLIQSEERGRIIYEMFIMIQHAYTRSLTANYFCFRYRWYVPLTYVYKSGPADQYDKPREVWMYPADDYSRCIGITVVVAPSGVFIRPKCQPFIL